jgi:hypothetical protein
MVRIVSEGQLWVNKISGVVVEITCINGNMIFFCQHDQPNIVGHRGLKQWREQFEIKTKRK